MAAISGLGVTIFSYGTLIIYAFIRLLFFITYSRSLYNYFLLLVEYPRSIVHNFFAVGLLFTIHQHYQLSYYFIIHWFYWFNYFLRSCLLLHGVARSYLHTVARGYRLRLQLQYLYYGSYFLTSRATATLSRYYYLSCELIHIFILRLLASLKHFLRQHYPSVMATLIFSTRRHSIAWQLSFGNRLTTLFFSQVYKHQSSSYATLVQITYYYLCIGLRVDTLLNTCPQAFFLFILT